MHNTPNDFLRRLIAAAIFTFLLLAYQKVSQNQSRQVLTSLSMSATKMTRMIF